MYSFVPDGWFYRMGPALLFVLPAFVSAVPAGVHAQEVASGLFTSHEVIELTLDADFVKLKGDRGLESEYRPAVLTVTADDGAPRVIDMKVKTRGLFRLRTCRFPPLKVNLPKDSLGGTVFDGEDKISIHIPVPYDFDLTGLVAASYARPDERLGLRTIKERRYRGFCRPEVDFSAIYSEFTELRPELEEIYVGLEGFRGNKREDALKYLDGFYDIISSEKRARMRIEEACRRM